MKALKERVGGDEGAADAPFLGVEVVGASAEVLDEAEALAAEADLHDAAWGVSRQNEGFALQVADGIVEGELYAWGAGGIELVGGEGRQLREGGDEIALFRMLLGFAVLLQDGTEEALTAYPPGEKMEAPCGPPAGDG